MRPGHRAGGGLYRRVCARWPVWCLVREIGVGDNLLAIGSVVDGRDHTITYPFARRIRTVDRLSVGGERLGPY